MTAQVKRFPKLSPEIKEQLRDDAAFNRLQAAARKADLLSYAIGGRMALELNDDSGLCAMQPTNWGASFGPSPRN